MKDLFSGRDNDDEKVVFVLRKSSGGRNDHLYCSDKSTMSIEPQPRL